MDGGGGRVTVSVWNGSHSALAGVQSGSGVSVVGCSATQEHGQVKLSIWPSAHVCSQGDQVETLTDLDASTVSTQTLTATFTPGLDLAALVADGALPTCAVALGEAVARGAPVAFQINRCILDPPLEDCLLYTSPSPRDRG